MGYPMRYTRPEEIFNEMRLLTPSYAGISYERMDQEGVQWPCPTFDHPGTPYLHKGRFTRGRGKFHAVHHAEPAEVPDGQYPLVLTTGRILYQYHASSMTGRTRGLVQLAPECLVELSPADARDLGVEDGSFVRVASRRGEIRARAKVTARSPKGCVFVPFHFAEAAANRLTHAALDPISKIPEFKACAVRVEKIS